MYHDRYSRRRAADSFHEQHQHELEETSSKEAETWSWKLFLGVLLVQVTSRCVYSSLGVIISHLFRDEGPSWELLTIPLAYIVTAGITEPWVIRLCRHLNNCHDYMYIVMAGTILSWLGTLISVKLPIHTIYLVPLVGILGGFGANITSTSTMCLLQEYYPKRPPMSIRTFESAFTSITFSLVPILSNCILDIWGHHGGLLIHSGIIMQGLIGAALIQGTHWVRQEVKTKRGSQSFPFAATDEENNLMYHSSSDADSDEDSYDKSELATVPMSSHLESEEHSGKNWRSLNPAPRMAFGLRSTPDTPPEKRRKRSTFRLRLSSIVENIEEEEEEEEEEINEIKEEDETEEVDEENENDEGAVELRDHEDRSALSSRSNSFNANPIEKPPRSFTHTFPEDRVFQNETDLLNYAEDIEYADGVDVESARNEIHIETKMMSLSWRSFRNFPIRDTVADTGSVFSDLWEAFKNFLKQFTNPYLVPAAFLLYSTQSALFTFISLTPVLLDEYIDDATKVDGAYCVCVMGFTWLCFVIASPCFSCIQDGMKSNHQTLCVLSLLTSSLSLYMVSQSYSLDALVLYSSLFGLSYGVSNFTSGSLLELTIGSRNLYKMSVLISIFTATFHLLSLLLISFVDWGGHLKNLYALPACTMALSSLIWGIHGCVASLRSKRGRHEITWARRRRFS